MYSKTTRPRPSYSFTVLLFLIFNTVFVLLGLGALAVGIWLAVDRIFVTNVVGSALLAVGAFGLIVAGGITLIVAMIGVVAVYTNNKTFAYVYLGLVIFIFVILLVCVILAIVFRYEIGEHMRSNMYDLLMEKYGVDQQHQWNRDVTWAWDQYQERLQCCGVEYNGVKGYSQYKLSAWYKTLPDIDQREKPMVPKSCCKRDPVDYRIIDQSTCQTFKMGPPHLDGGTNNALHIHDCLNQGIWYMHDHSGVVIGVGIGIVAIMIAGILLSVLFIRSL